MKKMRNILRNTAKIIKLQYTVNKAALFHELLSTVAGKAYSILTIVLPAIVIDLVLKDANKILCGAVIAVMTFMIVLFDFVNRKSRDMLSAHSSKTDNLVSMRVSRKAMSLDYKDLMDSSVLDLEAKGERAIYEFLEIDYVVLCDIGGAVIALLGLGYVIAAINIFSLLVVFAAACVRAAISKKIAKVDHKYTGLISEYTRTEEYFKEIIFDTRFAKEIQIYDYSENLTEKYREVSQKVISLEDEKARKINMWHSIDQVVNLLNLVLIFLLAIRSFYLGAISISAFMLCITGSREITDSVKELFDGFVKVARINDYFADYEAFMNLPETIYKDVETNPKAKSCIGDEFTFEFQNVSFMYPGSDTYALKDVSVTLDSKSIISVVGENGAGKTTFVYLLMRMFDVTEGRILLNGTDIREYPFSEYQRLVSPVFQDYEVLAYSIRENVAFDKNISRDFLDRCYEAADLDGLISGLPDKDETLLTKDLYDDGVVLSGGEKQKLAIARAYCHDGKVIILDEPTAAIDPLSEYRIFKNISTQSRQKLTVFVSHRLTSTFFSDKILVFDGGRLIQQGNHKELLAQPGIYAEMFSKQAVYYS